MLSHEQVISTLNLEPLSIEGGYFKRIFESDHKDADGRRFSASIFFLLAAPDFSCFHRIDCDELFHFYGGAPLTVYQIHPDGSLTETLLGNILENPAATPFMRIAKGTWFAAELTQKTGFSLIGCTTIPEFKYETYTADTRELCAQFPQHKELITRLTRV
jgi:predicted cupin superfamily sugar epimerase